MESAEGMDDRLIPVRQDKYDPSSAETGKLMNELEELVLSSQSAETGKLMNELEELVLSSQSAETCKLMKELEELIHSEGFLDVDSAPRMCSSEGNSSGSNSSSSCLTRCDSEELESRPPSRGDLVVMLQQCVASHMSKKATTVRQEPPRGRRRRQEQEEQLVAGLEGAMIKRPRAAPYVLRAAVSRDIMSLLNDCAAAVAARDVAAASGLAATIRRNQGAAPRASTWQQRLAFYFVEALMARALGAGAAISSAAATRNAGDAAEAAMTVYSFRIKRTPSPLLPHFFSTEAINRAVSGYRAIHVVDIGMARNRFQWSLLLHSLALRPGGPPLRLRVTAFDAPHHAALLQTVGRDLLAEAERLGISKLEYEVTLFELDNWEAGLSQLRTSPAEVLVVNSLFALDWIEDDPAVWVRNRRAAALAAVAKLRPRLVVLGVNDGRLAATKEVRFLDRFVQAAARFSAKFDAAAECSDNSDEEGRRAYEGDFLAAEMVNLVACDGRERLVRTAPYEDWARAMVDCGFHLLPLGKDTLGKAMAMAAPYNRHWGVESDGGGGWLKLSWKGVTTQCVSAWSPMLTSQPQQSTFSPGHRS